MVISIGILPFDNCRVRPICWFPDYFPRFYSHAANFFLLVIEDGQHLNLVGLNLNFLGFSAATVIPRVVDLEMVAPTHS